MALVSLRDVSVSRGGPLLLDRANLQIERGERVCLLGRNGVGKSTLMALIRGDLAPDGGEVARQPGVRVAHLSQEVPAGRTGNVFDLIAGGLDDAESWDVPPKVERVLTRMKLDGGAAFEALSSGMKRRVLLARAIVGDPDVLLLDEPTNHLDIDAIRWLEDFLLRFEGTLLFVTHDRVFLQALATRIVEIDRGKLFDWTCDYPTFLKRREEAALAGEAQPGALSSIRSWRRRRSGFVKGDRRPDGPATRDESAPSRRCADERAEAPREARATARVQLAGGRTLRRRWSSSAKDVAFRPTAKRTVISDATDDV